MQRILIFTVILLSAFTVFSHGRVIGPDFWGQLAFGRHILTRHEIPARDIYSYMPVKDRWINHEWGAAVIFYWVHHAFGGAGIMILKIGSWMLITLLCCRICREKDARPVYILLVYAICFRDFFIGINNRPHLFTYLFFALFLWVISAYRNRPNRLFVLPLVNLFWANLHGGIVAGFGILFLFFFGRWYADKRMDPRIAVAFLLCLLTPLVNPYGMEYYRYLLPAVSMSRAYIGEWRPLNLADFDILNNYKLLLGVTALSLCLKFERKECPQYLILIFTTGVSLMHIRHTPFFFIACMAFLPGILTGVGTNLLQRLQNFPCRSLTLFFEQGHFTSVVTVLGLVLSLNAFAGRVGGDTRILSLVTPVSYGQVGGYVVPRMMTSLIRKKGLKGNMAVEFAWGEYVIWKLGDRCKVSLDGRLETVYTKESIDAYFDFVNARGKGWKRLLTKYGTDMVLIRVNCPAYARMLEEKDWQLASRYYDSALFLKSRRPAAP